MSKNKGWIKLHRKLQDSPDYFKESFCRNMAWVDLLLLANHKETYERVRGVRVKTERGQIGLSTVELAKRWKWSRGKVFRFLNELELDHQIVQQKDNVTTLISILNYGNHQDGDTANDTADGQQTIQQTGSKRAADLYNEVKTNELQAPKNDKNGKKERSIGGEGGFSPMPHEKIAVIKAHDGSLVLESANAYKASDFNGIPDNFLKAAIDRVFVVKQVQVDEDQIKRLWSCFKELELHKKLYRNVDDVYSFFSNYCTRQTWLRSGRSAATKTTKSAKSKEKIIGVEFLNNFSQCKMNDGSIVDLNTNQKDSAKHNMINPSSIVKN